MGGAVGVFLRPQSETVRRYGGRKGVVSRWFRAGFALVSRWYRAVSRGFAYMLLHGFARYREVFGFWGAKPPSLSR